MNGNENNEREETERKRVHETQEYIKKMEELWNGEDLLGHA